MPGFTRRRRTIVAALALTIPAAVPIVLASAEGSEAHMSSQPAGRAEATPEVEARNKAVVEASFNAWREGKGSPYDLLTDDARWTIVGRSAASRTYESREAFLREVIRPFNARMREPLKPVIRRIYTDSDTVIVFFDARGTARDGKPYVNTYAWFLEMRDQRVVAASAFFDSLEFNELWARVTPAASD